MTKKTTFLPRLRGVELVVIGFELVGVGLLWPCFLSPKEVVNAKCVFMRLLLFLSFWPVVLGVEPVGFGVELVVIGFEPVEIESIGFVLGLGVEPVGLELELVGFGLELELGLESFLLLQVRGLYSCVLRVPPGPVEFFHYY